MAINKKQLKRDIIRAIADRKRIDVALPDSAETRYVDGDTSLTIIVRDEHAGVSLFTLSIRETI